MLWVIIEMFICVSNNVSHVCALNRCFSIEIGFLFCCNKMFSKALATTLKKILYFCFSCLYFHHEYYLHRWLRWQQSLAALITLGRCYPSFTRCTRKALCVTLRWLPMITPVSAYTVCCLWPAPPTSGKSLACTITTPYRVS